MMTGFDITHSGDGVIICYPPDMPMDKRHIIMEAAQELKKKLKGYSK